MATLKSSMIGDHPYVPALCIIGRAPDCDVRLSSRLASSVHAEIRWNGSAWELRDLSSRNGTYVDQRRISSDERVELRLKSISNRISNLSESFLTLQRHLPGTTIAVRPQI